MFAAQGEGSSPTVSEGLAHSLKYAEFHRYALRAKMAASPSSHLARLRIDELWELASSLHLKPRQWSPFLKEQARRESASRIPAGGSDFPADSISAELAAAVSRATARAARCVSPSVLATSSRKPQDRSSGTIADTSRTHPHTYIAPASRLVSPHSRALCA